MLQSMGLQTVRHDRMTELNRLERLNILSKNFTTCKLYLNKLRNIRKIKAECQRIDAFELWCWRRLLRVPWTARRSNQSILKEISPEYSLEGMMLKLKLQYLAT